MVLYYHASYGHSPGFSFTMVPWWWIKSRFAWNWIRKGYFLVRLNSHTLLVVSINLFFFFVSTNINRVPRWLTGSQVFSLYQIFVFLNYQFLLILTQMSGKLNFWRLRFTLSRVEYYITSTTRNSCRWRPYDGTLDEDKCSGSNAPSYGLQRQESRAVDVI